MVLALEITVGEAKIPDVFLMAFAGESWETQGYGVQRVIAERLVNVGHGKPATRFYTTDYASQLEFEQKGEHRAIFPEGMSLAELVREFHGALELYGVQHVLEPTEVGTYDHIAVVEYVIESGQDFGWLEESRAIAKLFDAMARRYNATLLDA